MLLQILKLICFTALIAVNTTLTSCKSSSSDIHNTGSYGSNASIINEAGNMNESADPNWWLSSGGHVYRNGGIISSVQGELPKSDRFRSLYAVSNSVDTDNGSRPQNILRLVTRNKFKNFTQQVFFNIKQINTSHSPNRNQSNGVFFFNRYQDSKNLYYAGIRVDGYAVIKKKLNGQYYTLKTAPVYSGAYNHDTQPNLLPTGRWIGFKVVVEDTADNNVAISIYLNDQQLGPNWTKVLEAKDTGNDAERIKKEGYAGIRTDFMDVSFNNYEAAEKVN